MTIALIIAGVVLILLAGCFCCLFCMGATRAGRRIRARQARGDTGARETRGDTGAAYARGHHE